MRKTLTTEEFVKKAQKVHKNKYDYSKVDYKDVNKKIIIICKKHGEFRQTLSSHLKGCGCSKCSYDRNRSSLKDFIKKSIKAHGNRYDYSQVNYINNRTKVCIICSIHGTFWQIPDNHWRLRCGCSKCSGKILLTTEVFIARAKAIHKNKYCYDKVEYKRNNIKVKIICKDHGVFLQTPQHHMDGSQCPKCSNNQQMSQKDFIEKATKIHGDRYDYSKIRYEYVKNKGIIICKKHGEFRQKLDNHLQGKGCPHCVNKSEGKVKSLLLKYFKDWNIFPNKKIWDQYEDYNHKRFCDFWLEKNDIKVMVEYDGQQHFKPVCFNGISIKKAEKELKQYQLKDKLDKQFCKENNIILHRIQYDENKEKSVKELLSKILKIIRE